MTFDTLPYETVLMVATHLPLSSLSALSCTCHHLHALLQRSLDKALSRDAERILFWAACNGNTQALTRAIDAGANVSAVTLDPEWLKGTASRSAAGPLHCAAMNGHVDAIRILVKHGAKIDDPELDARFIYRPLEHIAVLGKVDAIKQRLCAASNIQQPELLKIVAGTHLLYPAFTKHQFPGSLQMACRMGMVEVVKALLDEGADINGLGGSPLREAVEQGHLAVVKLLIEYGADTCVVNRRGRCLVSLARDQGKHDIVEFLLERGHALADQWWFKPIPRI